MERFRTIANKDDPDPSFCIPCRRCAELLQEGNRFCPFCFEDQLRPVASDDIAPALKTKTKADGRAGSATDAPDGFDFMDTVQPDARGLVPYWQTEVLGTGEVPHWAARFASTRRLLPGIVSGLVLMVLAFLGLEHVRSGDQGTAARLATPTVDVGRVQIALNRGDLNTAEQALEDLEIDHADAPGVRALREAFDLRVRERHARRAQPAPVAGTQEAFSALALDETVASAAPAAPIASPVSVSEPAPGTAAPAAAQECGQALVALALCPER